MLQNASHAARAEHVPVLAGEVRELLAVAAEDPLEVPLGCLVHELACREVGRRVHAHVERRVGGVRETALRSIDLHRRDAEVEQDRVGANAVVGELPQHDGEVAAEKPRRHAGPPAEALEVRLCARVAVDRDQLAAAAQLVRQERRVPTCAERRVHDRLSRAHSELAPHLLGENGDVISLVWLQDARQHAARSLPLPSNGRATRRGPRSPGGRRPRRRRPRARGSRARRARPGA